MEYYERFNQAIKQVFGDDIKSDLPDSSAEDVGLLSKSPTVSTSTTSLDESFVRLGDTYVHLKKYSDALDCYREALKINNKNVMAFNRLLIIPPHFTKGLAIGSETLSITPGDKDRLELLALNDSFRQTLIGGYVVLSRTLMQSKSSLLNNLFWTVQNLDQKYFNRFEKSERNFGLIIIEKTSYVWMINHCEYESAEGLEKFPVLILMTREEYRALKKIITQP